MFYQEISDKMTKIQDKLLEFIEKDDNIEEYYQSLNAYFTEQKFGQDSYNFKLILYMISNIAKHHHRNRLFSKKIERILLDLKSFILYNFSNLEIFQIFKGSKPIILFLLQEKMITIDQTIYDKLIHDTKYQFFLKPELDSFINEGETVKYDDEFQEKRKRGENDSYICEIIRKDLIDEFQNFVSQNGHPLNSTISPSIFETNPLLIKEQSSTLIEYAAFFGSIQIFKFLYSKGIELTSSLWIYGIHSNNLEIINFLEEKKIKPNDKSFEECFFEAIKCYHNNLANYIHNFLFIMNNESFEKKFLSCSFRYYNFSFIPNEINNNFILDCSCKYDYYIIVEYFLKNRKIDLNNENVFLIFLRKFKFLFFL